MSKEIQQALAMAMTLSKKRAQNKIRSFYPDTGPLRRELYKPHMDFFEAGQWARERCIIAANGIGKTEGIGGFELAIHLTGDYPDWWQGKRFNHPIQAWAAGDTNTTTRDIIQTKLLGPPGNLGTGLIPKEAIIEKSIRSRPGVPDAIESLRIKNIFGGESWLSFKSYEQGRKSFQGTEKHVIWLDEECPELVYDECLMRTRTVGGIIMLTFTPLSGLTQVVLGFMKDGMIPANGKVNDSRFVNNATWDDAPHLTKKERQEIIENTLPHLRDSRSKGIPNLGSGAIYPIHEKEVEIEDFEIPIWWPRVYALDYGWNWTAVVWAAIDKENDIIYINNVYKRGLAEPPIHVNAIKARGDWIPGVADPAGGTSQRDGRRLLTEYQQMLGDLFPADNAVEAGILAVWKRITTGKLKVFTSCRSWFGEFRVYRRDEKGRIIKQNDHLMDATRYLVKSGLQYAIVMPDEDDVMPTLYQQVASGRSTVTGY